ncbi:MAG: hypothetical protein II565_00965 [Fibrobacter sp.]|jgi:hypothetical protein|nr:hypothetical protein [Fibrobacter sp.]
MILFKDIAWSKHSTFGGNELKHSYNQNKEKILQFVLYVIGFVLYKIFSDNLFFLFQVCKLMTFHFIGGYIMKKIILFLFFCASIGFAQTGIFVSLGRAYHGLVGVEQTFLNQHLSANLHWLGYDSDYDFMGGLGVAYRFNGLTGPYVFHTSEWLTGRVFNSDRDKYDRFNYWRLVFGFGLQHMFTKNLGVFFETGFEFYAGEGGYYTYLDMDDGGLSKDAICLPMAFGLTVQF